MYKLRLTSLFALLLLVSACKTVTYLADTEVNYLDTDSYYPADEKITNLIAPYSDQLSEKMDVVISYLDEDLKKDRPNSNLGNWFTDILLAEAQLMFPEEKIDLALQNYGGLRVPVLKKGELTVGEIYELMPFDNTLVLIKLDGKVLQQLMDHICSKGGWPLSKSISLDEQSGKAVNIMMNDLPIDLEKTYTIAVPDYVANGGDAAAFLKAYPQIESGVFIRDIIINHLQTLHNSGNKFNIDNTKRIH